MMALLVLQAPPEERTVALRGCARPTEIAIRLRQRRRPQFQTKILMGRPGRRVPIARFAPSAALSAGLVEQVFRSLCLNLLP